MNTVVYPTSAGEFVLAYLSENGYKIQKNPEFHKTICEYRQRVPKNKDPYIEMYGFEGLQVSTVLTNATQDEIDKFVLSESTHEKVVNYIEHLELPDFSDPNPPEGTNPHWTNGIPPREYDAMIANGLFEHMAAWRPKD